MRNLLKGLETNEKDNILTVAAKSGLGGYLKASMFILPIFGAVLLVGKSLPNQKEINRKFEEETGA